MSYAGQTYMIPLNNTGFSHSPNIDVIPINSIIDPSRNINIHENGIRKRGGTTKVDTTAVGASFRTMGMTDFLLYDGTHTQPFAGNDGKVYKDRSTVLKTGMSTANHFNFTEFKNVLYITDGATRPQTWDGSAGSTTDIASIPTDWSGSNMPAQLLVHNKGLSKRLVALVFSTTKENFYLSKNDDGGDFSDAQTVIMKVRTGDAHGIVGGATFGDRLIVFGKNNAWILDDEDTDSATWGMSQAQWGAGVAHHRLLVKTPTDLLAMTEDGVIYSVTAAQSYGDYKAANLTRPSFVDRWIRDNVDLTEINNFHALYDPNLRAVRWFVVRKEQTGVNTCLLYFIDRTPELAWTIHDNQSYNSGYSASASCVVRTTTGAYEVRTGDYSGFQWKLEQETRSDDGNGYWGGIRTSRLTFENPRLDKHFRRGALVTLPQGSTVMTVRWFVDSAEEASQAVPLAGEVGFFDESIFDDSVFGEEELINSYFDLGQVGKRLQVEIYNNIAGQDFFLSALMIDFKPLGVQPE